jgi:tRNA A37 methylthiotransferase MiaB
LKSYYIINSSHPCTEIVLEVNQLKSYFTKGGYTESPSLSSADLIVVSTCAFNNQYETNAVESIHKALAQKAVHARIIVSGCLSKINPKLFAELREKYKVEDLPPRNMEKIEQLVPLTSSGIDPKPLLISDIIPNFVTLDEYRANSEFMAGIKIKTFCQKLQRALPFVKMPGWTHSIPMPDWYFIRGGTGCLGKCTYCAIRRARGKIKSHDLAPIIDQLRRAINSGKKNISFAGDDLGCWGTDKDMTLPDLLNAVVKVPGDFQVDLRFIEPEYLLKYFDKLMPIFSTGKIASFCSPIESGSQRILGLMKRNYDANSVITATNDILRATRVKGISSIIMTGFPTETVEDYAASYNLIRRSKISLWQILSYEGRPNTLSETLTPKIDFLTKKNRHDRLETHMKLVNFLGAPGFLSEKIVSAKFGEMV